jgi:hypothetical protein
LRVLLTILCAIIVLFAGGCALTLVAGSGIGGALFAAPFALIPGGLAFLNILVIGALWGKMKVRKGAFLTLAILDALVVLMSLPLIAEVGIGNTEDFLLIGLPVLLFVLKGIFTFIYWRNL